MGKIKLKYPPRKRVEAVAARLDSMMNEIIAETGVTEGEATLMLMVAYAAGDDEDAIERMQHVLNGLAQQALAEELERQQEQPLRPLAKVPQKSWTVLRDPLGIR